MHTELLRCRLLKYPRPLRWHRVSDIAKHLRFTQDSEGQRLRHSSDGINQTLLSKLGPTEEAQSLTAARKLHRHVSYVGRLLARIPPSGGGGGRLGSRFHSARLREAPTDLVEPALRAWKQLLRLAVAQHWCHTRRYFKGWYSAGRRLMSRWARRRSEESVATSAKGRNRIGSRQQSPDIYPGNDTVEGLLCDAAALPHHAFFLIWRSEKDANCRLREGDLAGSAGEPAAPPGRRRGCRQGTATSSKGPQDF